jgi:hypothetical protein
MTAPLRASMWATVLALLCACSGATLPGRMPAQSLERPTLLQPQPGTSACRPWRVVGSAKPDSTNASLYGVGGDSPSDIWSVGGYQSSPAFRTLAERWNGTAWQLEQTPNVGSGDNDLVAVAAVSPSDVWAVGFSTPTSTSTNRALIEHWDGRTWSVVSSPSPGQLSGLSDVKAVSSSDVWAVGAYFNFAGNQQTLVEHWNGRSWKVESSPSPGASYNDLAGLAIVSARDIWAVGSSSSSASSQTLVERWNGTTWQAVPSLDAPRSLYNSLAAIVAIDANDIWAVGSSEPYTTYASRTLVERWSGSSWEIVPSPNVGPHGNVLAGVAALSNSDVWAVGSYIDSSNFLPRTLVEHWNGSVWRSAKSPNPGSLEDQLHAISLVGSDLWSVGNEATPSENDPLTLRCSPRQVRRDT